jgi:hypothetical protein
VSSEDIFVTIFLGVIVYAIVTLFTCAACFGGEGVDGPFLEENKKNYIVICLWPITLVFLLPVIVILLFKLVWWMVKAAGLYLIGIKDLYKELVAR